MIRAAARWLVILLSACHAPMTVAEDPPPVATEPCQPGEQVIDGGCVPAGVPPGGCGEGFVDDGASGCSPVLPAPCGPGMLAVPGETACHEPAACGDAPYGEAPAEPTTQYVDGSFTPASKSDGSPARPWTTLSVALEAAAPGAVIAIAAGKYLGDLTLSKPVRLWGRCPAKVTLQGVDPLNAAVFSQTDDVEIHTLAVTGPNLGLYFQRNQAVVDRAWIRDTGSAGIIAEGTPSLPGRVQVSGTLVEHAAVAGVVAQGGVVELDRSTVRGTASANGTFGRGVQSQSGAGREGVARVTRSVIERNHQAGAFSNGSVLDVVASVIRGTLPAKPGPAETSYGLAAQVDAASGKRGRIQLSASVLDGDGINCAGCDARVVRSTIKDTAKHPNDTRGIIVGTMPATKERGRLAIDSSTVTRAATAGILVNDGAAWLSGVAILETAIGDGGVSGGITGYYDGKDEPTAIEVHSSRLEKNRIAGVLLLGGDLLVDSSLIADGLPRPGDGFFGRGIQAQDQFGHTPEVVVRRSLLTRNFEAGILGVGTHLVVEDSVLSKTKAGSIDQQLGDGIVLIASNQGAPGSADLARVLVSGSARAGVANFGVAINLGVSKLECNAIALNGEVWDGKKFTFSDLGENRCGCGAKPDEGCKVLSASLSPPGALAGN